jgi:N-acyl homoserine lactone hydrolase
MSRYLQSLLWLCSLMVAGCTPLAHADTVSLRLYVLDCGRAELADAGALSDTGELAGQPRTLVDPCFLIQHPAGWLLWDAGLAPDTASQPGLTVHAGVPLGTQLARLGLTVDAITYVAFSHMHFDHVGNAKLFARATWLLNRAELAWAEHEPAHVSMVASLFDGYRHAHTQLFEGDYDVFGDGRVRIISAPGHTPGSGVLWVNLPKTGPVLLSGDLYVARESRRFGYVPSVNADRADTLASMARIERILKRTHARLVIQHDPHDHAELPHLPDSWQ